MKGNNKLITSEKHLLLLQTGPVQDFITAARTTDDLFSGSYLIAYLTAAGIKYVRDNGGEIIFPCLENQTVFERICGETKDLGQPTLPNRFLAEVPAAHAGAIARGAEAAIRNELAKISAACFDGFCKLFSESGSKYEKRWNKQVERFLQIAWQTVPLKEDWGESYADLLANLAARRNTRNFVQYSGDDGITELQKDALNGKDEIVGDLEEWEKIRGRKNFTNADEKSTGDKPYGALSVIKRLWGECYLKQSIEAENYSAFQLKKRSSGEAAEYIAAIQMDGDHMGSILSSQDKKKDFFTRFSKKLANFTRQEADKIVSNHKGRLIYAGGDDVLAIVPACEAVACARELREKFCADEPDMPGSENKLPDVPKVTLSAGIAFAHWKTPLIWLLEEARAAEHRAKNEYQRDALAISIVKRGGEILQWGAKFESRAWDAYKSFIDLDKSELISGKFATALAMFLRPYGLEELREKETAILSNIIKSDFALVCSRQVQKSERQQNEDEKRQLADFAEAANAYVDELKSKNQLADFPQLFLAGNFLIRKKQSNQGEKNA